MNVGEMQRKLSLWAEQDKERKFIDLYKLIRGMDWLRLAHDYVAQNAGKGTAGCDGVTMKIFDENLEENLQKIAEDLKSETYEPQPVRRTYIPKSDGRWRPLGIPALRDRIVQEAVRMVLEPIYEADFSQYSYGFRPNRCTMDAIQCIFWATREQIKMRWIIEGDISSYFDTMNHRKLMKLMGKRVEDKKILDLIWKFLRAGVMERETLQSTELGTPQGGIISPLLSNIYLHELDRYMRQYLELPARERRRRRTEGSGNFAYIRYADDFVALCNGGREQAEAMKEKIYQFLKQELRLELSKEKTKITHLNDGFEFLGYRIQRRMGGKGMVTKILIPKEAVKRVSSKIIRITAPDTYQHSMNAKILALNRIIGGWCRYYQYTTKASTEFGKLGYEVFWQMAHWLGRKYRCSMPEVMRRFRAGNTFATSKYKLTMPGEFGTLRYRKSFKKPNPYTMQEIRIQREELPLETYWTGHEPRPGMEDLRPAILRRDDYTCQRCGKQFNPKQLQVDHTRPVRRFKRPVDANRLENLQTVCGTCHKIKTESDRQMESPLQGNLHGGFGGGHGETYTPDRPYRTKRVRSFVRNKPDKE